jgi:hypothetical protein
MRYENLDLWGYPLFYREDGRRIRSRLIKKLIKRHMRGRYEAWQAWGKEYVADGKTLFRVCGQPVNSVFHGIEDPCYRRVGLQTWMLVDADVQGAWGGGCSLSHCGIDPAEPLEEVKRQLKAKSAWLARGEISLDDPVEDFYAKVVVDDRGVPIEEVVNEHTSS